MFAFHETTRKRTCRTAFFALCLAPTCATAAWIADHYLPWRAAAAARRLSDRYHLAVTLADWQDPRPNMTRLAAVTLAEPGAVAPLLNLSQVETHRRGDVLIVSIDELSLRIADLPALAARLEWTLARTPAKKLELHIQKLSLHKAATGGRAPRIESPLALINSTTPNPSSTLTLHRLQGVIERDPHNHPRVRLLAHLTEDVSAVAKAPAETTSPAPQKPIGLSVETIQKAGAPPRQVIAFDTQQNAIPVALFAPLIPGAAALTDTTTFNGIVSWQVEEGPNSVAAITGSLRGRVEQFDLATLLPPHSPHVLRGAAAIELTEVRWQGEQLHHLAGTLTARDGEVNHTLLDAAVKYLICLRGEQLAPAGEGGAPLATPLAIDALACRFDLDKSGFALWGAVEQNEKIPAGCIATSGGQPLLLEPRYMPSADGTPPLDDKDVSRLPLASWVQFADSPIGLNWIPYSPAALDIAERLPPQTPAAR